VLLEPPRTEVKLESHDASLGPASAPVTIVEFSDYQ
jgi:protein-disulfide isomerase